MKKGPTKRERHQERERIVRDNWHRALISIIKLKMTVHPSTTIRELAKFIGRSYTTTIRILQQHNIEVTPYAWKLRHDSRLRISAGGKLVLGKTRLRKAEFEVGQLIRIKVEPGRITLESELESELESNQNSEIENSDDEWY